MAAKFVLQTSNDGLTRVELVSAQGQRLLSSDAYGSKSEARNAVSSFRRAAAEAELVDADAPDSGPAKKSAAKKAGKKSAAKKATEKTGKKAAGKKTAGKKAAKKAAKKLR